MDLNGCVLFHACQPFDAKLQVREAWKNLEVGVRKVSYTNTCTSCHLYIAKGNLANPKGHIGND